jgi:hypothetical protein
MKPQLTTVKSFITLATGGIFIKLFMAITGSAKAIGREPKTCLGRAFNYKLAEAVLKMCMKLIYVDARTHLYLKTRPRFCPIS